MMFSDAQFEQRHLDSEIDAEAAKLIREQGIPLYDAIELARERVQRKRSGGYCGKRYGEHEYA